MLSYLLATAGLRLQLMLLAGPSFLLMTSADEQGMPGGDPPPPPSPPDEPEPEPEPGVAHSFAANTSK